VTRLLALALLLGAAAGQAAAENCRDENYQGNNYSVCEVDLSTDTLGFFFMMQTAPPMGISTPWTRR
jgi:uncharacterized protein YigE (DUF2233 family)